MCGNCIYIYNYLFMYIYIYNLYIYIYIFIFIYINIYIYIYIYSKHVLNVERGPKRTKKQQHPLKRISTKKQNTLLKS